MQNKFDQILIKENQFLNSLNFNSFESTSNSLNYTKSMPKNVFNDNLSSFNVNPIPDDEDVRKNISEQINFVKIFL